MLETLVITLDRPLRELLVLQSRGKLRRTWKRLTSPRRAAATTLVAVLLCLYVVQIYIAVALNDSPTTFPIRSIAPLGMLGILCMKLVGVCIDRDKSGAGYRDEEIHCLLGGPFPTQQVRLYRVAGHAISIFFTSIFAAIFFRFHVTSFWAALCGAYLAMLFTYLVYTTVAVIAVNVARKTYVLLRAVSCAAAIAAMSYLLYRVSQAEVSSFSFLQCFGNEAIALAQTAVGRVCVSPFVVFTNVVVAESVSECVLWVGPSLLLNFIALQMLLQAEVHFERRARFREREEFRKKRHLMLLSDYPQSALTRRQWHRSIPWLGGSGPLVWRQVKALARLKGGLGWLLIPLASAFAVGGYFSYRPEDGAFQTIAVVVVLTSVFLPGLLPFDFRGDLKGLAALKMMPIRTTNVVLGQLIVPVFMLSFFQFLALSTLLIHDSRLITAILLALCVTLPTNTVIIALENLMFLLYPYRIAEFDFQATIRRILMLMAKFCVLFLAALLSLFSGFVVVAFKSVSDITPTASAAFTTIARPLVMATQLAALMAIAAGVVWATCLVYRRFDLSEDLPS